MQPAHDVLFLVVAFCSRWCILHVCIAIGCGLGFFFFFIGLFRVDEFLHAGGRFFDVAIVHNHSVEQLIRLGLVKGFVVVVGGSDEYEAG